MYKEVILLEKLNSIINIDLHIHSYLSEYKESVDYVKDSNVDNINILLDKYLFKKYNGIFLEK